MATKSEQSLLKLILGLDKPMSNDMNYLLSTLAKLRPDGSFYYAQDPERFNTKEIRFRYSFKSKTDRTIKAIVALEIRAPSSSEKWKEHKFCVNYRSLAIDDKAPFKNNERGRVYVSQYYVQEELRFTKGKPHEAGFSGEDALEETFGAFELKAFNQLKKQSTLRDRVARAERDTIKRKEEVLLALHSKLMTKHNLANSEAAERLFNYLTTHCNKDIRLIEKMFNEMAHIIQ
jgi:hypothetical protein